MNTITHKKDCFCRYVVMHRSIFWRFKRMGQANIYLPLGQKGKLLTHILKKLLKMVRIVQFHVSYFSQYNVLQPHSYLPCLPALALPQVSGSCQSSSALHESGFIQRPDSASMLMSPVPGTVVPSWTDGSMQTANLSHESKGVTTK